MRILQINAVNKIGSTGRTCYEMSEYFNQNGHTCVTAYSKGPSDTPELEYKIGSKLDTKLHGLLSRITGMQGYFSKSATKKLLKFMDEFKPDIVVLRNLHANYINLPMLLTYLAEKDIATVTVLHDCWFYTGKCCHYTVQGCYKWQEKCGGCPQLKKYNKSWFFDRTSKMQADKIKLFNNIPRLAVVGVSDWILNEAKKAPVFKSAKIFSRIYNWIDTEIFSSRDTQNLREQLGIAGKKVILSVASSWSNTKGLDSLLKISKRLNDNEKLVIVGNVPQEVVFNSNVIHIPATNSVDELAEYYSLADVFLQPSLEETFGKVAAEAHACGTPVVCFNSTANPELVGDGCGAVANIGDIDDMSSKIENVIANGKKLYSQNCRNFATSNFSKKDNLQEYLNLFKRISGDSI